MSLGQSAFRKIGESSEVQRPFQLTSRFTGSGINGSISSETPSSIPELSRAEEQAIKRSSASFAPIGQDDEPLTYQNMQQSADDKGRMSQSKGDFAAANWMPSPGLMMTLDRASTSKRTDGWDDDGLEVSYQNTNPSIDVIPSHVRGSTPDSVASSGNMRLTSGSGAHRYINTGNIQEHAEEKTSRQAAMDLAKSTRAYVQNMTDDDRPGTSAADIELEVSRRRPDETYEPEGDIQYEKSEKSAYFLPKCLLLVVILMIILAGIVALIVKFKEDKPEGQRGFVVPNPITYVECPSRSFRLGGSLNFTCTFDVTHAYRIKLKGADCSRLIPNNKVLNDRDSSTDVSCTSGGNSTHRTFVINVGKNATCSSEGSYNITFRKNETEIHTATVYFTIKPSSLTTTFNQRQLKGDNCTKSVFNATCELRKDCNNYDMSFYRDKNGREESLNSYVSCKRNYTNTEGYTVKCEADIPEDLVENFVFLGCRMDQLKEAFLLPSCGLQQSCKTYIPPNNRPFNCSAKSKDMDRLNNATCDFEILTSCFKPGREIFNYKKNYLNELTCSDEYTIPVCRLSWCRDYNYIIKDDIPGVAICSQQQYEEPYLTPTTPDSVET